MANYSELLNDINAAIYENNDQEIDALEVRAILREMVTSLGSGFLFKGIATPSSPSGTGTYEPDQNVFYLATTAGTYTYLGGMVVAAGEVAFLCFDGTWTKKSSALLSTGSIVDNLTTNDATKPLSAKQGKVLKDGQDATAAQVSALGHKVDGIEGDFEAGSLNYLTGAETTDPKSCRTKQIAVGQDTIIEYNSPVTTQDLYFVKYLAGVYAGYVKRTINATSYRFYLYKDNTFDSVRIRASVSSSAANWSAAEIAATKYRVFDMYCLEEYTDDKLKEHALFDYGIEQGKTINGTNGLILTDASSTLVRIDVLGGKTYQPILDKKKPGTYRIAYYSEEGGYTYISGTNSQTGAFTTPATAKSVIISTYGSTFTTAELLLADSYVNTLPNEGFDAIPTAGSSNFVRSGGVKTEQDTHGLFDFTIEANKTINGVSGVVVSNTGSAIAKTTIIGGKTYQPIFDGVFPQGNNVLPGVYRIAFFSNYNYTGYISGTNSQTGTFTTPSNAKSVIVSDYFNTFSKVEFIETSYAGLGIIYGHEYKRFIGPYTPTNNVLWIGTSIPEGSQYPKKSCEANGLVCLNKSLGSSKLCFTNTHPAVANSNSGKCLTASVAELEALYRADVTGGVITEATLTSWKNYSYENSILPYVNGTDPTQASMIVLDHGYNDRATIAAQLANEASIDFDDDDRSTFSGAFRYLLDRIQEANPFVKIVIAGYITDSVGNLYKATSPSTLINSVLGKEICRMQSLLADYYNISIMKAWEETQFANYYIAGSASYLPNFNSQYSKNYALALITDADGNIISNPNDYISSFQLYCPDCIHPHTDLTGNSDRRLNAVFTKLLSHLI